MVSKYFRVTSRRKVVRGGLVLIYWMDWLTTLAGAFMPVMGPVKNSTEEVSPKEF